MTYDIHTETADGVSVSSIFRDSVIDAYDHCVDCAAADPKVTAVHLYLGEKRLHTVRRPQFAR